MCFKAHFYFVSNTKLDHASFFLLLLGIFLSQMRKDVFHNGVKKNYHQGKLPFISKKQETFWHILHICYLCVCENCMPKILAKEGAGGKKDLLGC